MTDTYKYHETQLLRMLEKANVKPAPVYQPGQVKAVLCLSTPTFRRLCDIWEPTNTKNRSNEGLECYVIGGHRRVPHHALVEWLMRNNQYERKYGIE